MGDESAPEKKEPEHTKVRYRQIGDVNFKVVSFYHGDRTYADIVKSVLRREIEAEKAETAAI